MRGRTTNLQIRSFPVRLRERLRQRAERKGLSMSQYMIELARRDLEHLSTDEWLELLTRRKRVRLTMSTVDLIRQARRDLGWEG